MTERMGSPSRRSIFTTSAPQSASAAAADGTKPCSEKSTILIPASGSVMKQPCAFEDGLREAHHGTTNRLPLLHGIERGRELGERHVLTDDRAELARGEQGQQFG